MKFIFVFMCAAVLFGAAGCVSYSYTGEKCARESAAVAVFTDSAKIDSIDKLNPSTLKNLLISQSCKQLC